MKGNPKNLNSKFDYEYIKEHCDVEFWLPRWENLLAQRYHWMPTKVLTSQEEGIEDETHRIDVQRSEVDGEEKVVLQQLEYVEDPYSDFARFGFTLEEVNAAIAEGKAKQEQAAG